MERMMTLFIKRLAIVSLALTLALGSLALFSSGASAKTLGESISDRAEQYVGKKIDGFDSADFVSYVFEKEGIKLPSNNQLIDQGKLVSKSNLLSGDLLFFGTSRNQLKTVGIYIGGNEFVVAYPPYGEIKKINLNSEVAKKNYQGAKRVLTEAASDDSAKSSTSGIFPMKKGTYKPYRDNFAVLRTWSPSGRTERSHEGIDIAAPTGTPLYSATDGKIVRYGWNYYGGWRVGIRTGDYYVYYAHMDKYAPGLYEGATVKKGQLIGYVGKTGYGPPGTEGVGSHLHFGIYKNGNAINPYPYLKSWEK
jgi:murein DD-endopeptidase MepM/ murein hydrolase activator NlpD